MIQGKEFDACNQRDCTWFIEGSVEGRSNIEFCARSARTSRLIDDVLDKDPEFPDALFLKAQILWEGFGNRKEALGCLKKLMQVVPDHEPLHRWASSYHNEITGMEN